MVSNCIKEVHYSQVLKEPHGEVRAMCRESGTSGAYLPLSVSMYCFWVPGLEPGWSIAQGCYHEEQTRERHWEAVGTVNHQVFWGLRIRKLHLLVPTACHLGQEGLESNKMDAEAATPWSHSGNLSTMSTMYGISEGMILNGKYKQKYLEWYCLLNMLIFDFNRMQAQSFSWRILLFSMKLLR